MTRSNQNESSVERSELDAIYDAFGIGKSAREPHVLMTNLRNVLRRERCLAAIERTFFMVPTEPEVEDGGEPGEECLLNWGHDQAEYVRAFRDALKTISSPKPVGGVAVVPRGVYGPNGGRPGEPYGDADWIAQNHAAVIQFLERSVAASAGTTAPEAPQEKPAPMTREWCANYPGTAAGVINELARQIDAMEASAAEAKEDGELAAVLKGVDELLNEAYAHWDADREFKVGKILLALIGSNKGYDKRSDAWCAALTASAREPRNG